VKGDIRAWRPRESWWCGLSWGSWMSWMP
jgi:hypothetical protein